MSNLLLTMSFASPIRIQTATPNFTAFCPETNCFTLNASLNIWWSRTTSKYYINVLRTFQCMASCISNVSRWQTTRLNTLLAVTCDSNRLPPSRSRNSMTARILQKTRITYRSTAWDTKNNSCNLSNERRNSCSLSAKYGNWKISLIKYSKHIYLLNSNRFLCLARSATIPYLQC